MCGCLKASRFSPMRYVCFVLAHPTGTIHLPKKMACRAWLSIGWKWKAPSIDQWPSAGHQLLFDDLPLRQDGERVVVESQQPIKDARRLIGAIHGSCLRAAGCGGGDRAICRCRRNRRWTADMTFTDAMLAGYTAVLCSPGFICLDERPGPLSDAALATRLSLFLWNTSPDAELRAAGEIPAIDSPEILRAADRTDVAA